MIDLETIYFSDIKIGEDDFRHSAYSTYISCFIKGYCNLNLYSMDFDAEDFGLNFNLYFHKVFYFIKNKQAIDILKNPDYSKTLIKQHYDHLA